MKPYSQSSSPEQTSPHLTSLKRLGYTVVEGVLDSSQTADFSARLDEVYARQVAEFGEAQLTDIGEVDLARCPLSYDSKFLELALSESIHEVIRGVLGQRFLLHLQNGIINRPNQEHHQANWHRDLPYQEFTSSKPLAVSALVCLQNFTAETGGTLVLPGSHLFETFPSADYVARNELQVEARAGSAIIFDAMLYHRAGHNHSKEARRGVNHVFALEFIKQQIDLPRSLDQKYRDDPNLMVLLGYASSTADSVQQFRQRRLERIKT